ncbi:MAG: sulfatase-like hydrolase/transferase [Armatimonadota bacterium]
MSDRGRRDFLTMLTAGGSLMAAGARSSGAETGAGDARPNILWVTCEDIGPHLGCYGDAAARTPVLDRLAQEGVRYETAWSTCPVCAPARTTIITGVYAGATGGEHMRSMVPLPESIRMFPEYLRDAGYYCTNNRKEDYNHPKDRQVWDESSRNGHWKNRQPGQPFFAVFNATMTHESKIRSRPHTLVTDPAAVRVPAYHPDTPEVRHDWAQYHDNIADMDTWAGQRLEEIKQAGLWDDTIIVFFGDHGSGMPRGKRYPGDSGLLVPLIVRVPEKYRHLVPDDYSTGGTSDRLVGFIDLAPTMLSLAGVRPPEHMDGHAFMGQYTGEPPEYLYGFRGRMDERIDLVRSVRDQRYLYMRNYLPHRPHGQHVAYQFVTPTTRIWKEMYDKGELTPEQSHFWEVREPEELYDLEADPDEVHSLAGSAEHREVLERFRAEHRRKTFEIRDVLFVPEGELARIAAEQPPYTYGHDDAQYPLQEVLEIADAASRRDDASIPKLLQASESAHATIRYWAGTGLLVRGRDAVRKHADVLRRLLEDESPVARVPAAEALARYGDAADQKRAVDALLWAANTENVHSHTAVAALNAIDALEELPESVVDAVGELPTKDPRIKRGGGYVGRLVEDITKDE